MKSAVQPSKRRLRGVFDWRWILTLLKQLLLIGGSVLALYPVYYMVITAFKTREGWLHNQFGLPIPLTMANFVQALIRGACLPGFAIAWSSRPQPSCFRPSYRPWRLMPLPASASAAGRLISTR